MPQVSWPAVLPGAALSLLITIAGVPLIGAAAGGTLAGRLSPHAPAYQGSIVAILTILAFAVLPLPGPTDTVLILVTDALLIAVGAVAGWLGGLLRPSSSGTGRGP